MVAIGCTIVRPARPAWADAITESWQKSVEGILETGQLLIDAKADLPHGSFVAMIESDLPFVPQTARKLMAIANDHKLKGAHVRALPASWGTLYELTKLDDDSWAVAEKENLIRPDVERKEVAAFRREHQRSLTPRKKEPCDISCCT